MTFLDGVQTPDTLPPVAEPMKMRSFYVPGDLWDAAKEKARNEESRDISVAVRELLEGYVNPPEPDPEGDRRYAEGVAAGRAELAAEIRALLDP